MGSQEIDTPVDMLNCIDKVDFSHFPVLLYLLPDVGKMGKNAWQGLAK